MTHYTVLQLKVNCTLEEIKASYRRLAKQYHPDKGGDNDKFLLVQEAYDILSDSKKRKEYDLSFHVKKKTSTVKTPKNSVRVDSTIDLHISLDDLLKKEGVTVDNVYIPLPKYYTQVIEFKTGNTDYFVVVNLTSPILKVGKYKFKLSFLDGQALTILQNKEVYTSVLSSYTVITPRGPVGIDSSKIKKLSSSVYIPDLGIPVMNALGVICKTDLIVQNK